MGISIPEKICNTLNSYIKNLGIIGTQKGLLRQFNEGPGELINSDAAVIDIDKFPKGCSFWMLTGNVTQKEGQENDAIHTDQVRSYPLRLIFKANRNALRVKGIFSEIEIAEFIGNNLTKSYIPELKKEIGFVSIRPLIYTYDTEKLTKQHWPSLQIVSQYDEMLFSIDFEVNHEINVLCQPNLSC